MPKNPAVFLKFVLAGGAVLAAAGCGGRPGVVLDPGSQIFYETARLVMTGQERDIFNLLPDEDSRKEFIAEFWEKRDPVPETTDNEFKIEFEKRIEYANKHFREGQRGINTDRGRIYLYLGAPEKIDEYYNHSDTSIRGSIIWWVYYKYDVGIEFVDERGISSFAIRQISGNLLDAIEGAKLGEIQYGDGAWSKNFVDFKSVYERSKKELTLIIPVKPLSFSGEDGKLRANFDFKFYVYARNGAKKKEFAESRLFEAGENDLIERENISFAFGLDLEPGKSYIDIILESPDAGIKARRIFTVKN